MCVVGFSVPQLGQVNTGLNVAALYHRNEPDNGDVLVTVTTRCYGMYLTIGSQAWGDSIDYSDVSLIVRGDLP